MGNEYRERDYWTQRYAKGGHSGAGSRGLEFLWKVKTIRSLIQQFAVRSILDIGCGDGVVAAPAVTFGSRFLAEYMGVDLARHPQFPRLPFRQADAVEDELPQADLVLCLDVLFHIESDERHDRLVERICGLARRVVFVTTMNEAADTHAPHVFYRPVTWPPEFSVRASGLVPDDTSKTFYILEKSAPR